MAEIRAARSLGRSAGLIALVVIAAGFIAIAGMMMFSRFMLYDDEGYVLISLRNFATSGSLYREVYTQYGPLPYVFYYTLNLLGCPLTHVTGRIVTLLAWSGAALFSGAVVWRLSRSFALMTAVVAAVFVYLWIMVSEPTHPGGLVALIVAALAAGGGHWLGTARESRAAFVIGAGVAALALTKINVGAFAAISAGAFTVLHWQRAGVRRWGAWLVAAGFAVLPYALMRPLLGAAWVQTYAMVFALSGLTATGAVALGATPRAGTRELRAALCGAALVGIGVFGVVLARGTSPSDLLDGMLLGPLRHPVNFSLAFPWSPLTSAWAVGATALFIGARLLRRNARITLVDTLVAVSRLAVAGGLGWAIASFPATSPDNVVLKFGLPCLWLFLWPLGESASPHAAAARHWLGLLLLGQFLHPFPVPGSQIAWGTFLTIPLVALGTWEACTWLRHEPRLTRLALPHWSGLVASAALFASALFLGTRLASVGTQYFVGRSLELAGAEPIRLPDESTARYRVLTFNALVHADVLFSLPGMFSFNLWSGLPTPTLANVTHWFSLLSPAQQEATIHALERHPRAAVIVETGHLKFLRDRGLTPAGALHAYIERTYESAFAIDGFEFRVRKGRTIVPFFTAEIFQRSPGEDAAAPDRHTTRLVLPLLLPRTSAVASVEIVSLRQRAAPLLLRDARVRAELTPLTLQGGTRGATLVRSFPLTLDGPTSLALYFDGRDWPFDLADTLIVLRDSAGAELGLVRLRP